MEAKTSRESSLSVQRLCRRSHQARLQPMAKPVYTRKQSRKDEMAASSSEEPMEHGVAEGSVAERIRRAKEYRSGPTTLLQDLLAVVRTKTKFHNAFANFSYSIYLCTSWDRKEVQQLLLPAADKAT